MLCFHGVRITAFGLSKDMLTAAGASFIPHS